jgi:hypothetical protein
MPTSMTALERFAEYQKTDPVIGKLYRQLVLGENFDAPLDFGDKDLLTVGRFVARNNILGAMIKAFGESHFVWVVPHKLQLTLLHVFHTHFGHFGATKNASPSIRRSI